MLRGPNHITIDPPGQHCWEQQLGEVTGVRADRPQLAKLMAKIGPGDVVVVTSHV